MVGQSSERRRVGVKEARGVLSGQGPVYSLGGNLVSITARREETGGTYGLIEAIVPPRVGAPMHIHTREDEGFYVLEGELEFEVDGQRMKGTAGSFVHMPKDRPHGYFNRSIQSAKVICLYIPGGFEGFFEECGEPVGNVEQAVVSPRPAGPEKLLAVAKAFGMEIIGPPPSE